MKTKTTIFIICMFFAWLGNITYTKAQTSINILGAGDSTFTNYCTIPDTADFYLYGSASGYNNNDVFTFYINFGDGTDTTFTSTITCQMLQCWFGTFFSHIYTMPGNYSVMYVVTGPDGNADTLINQNELIVSGSCGNINGKVYIDINGNCQYDSGDLIVPYVSLILQDNQGNTITYAYTDINGNYFIQAINGINYNLIVSNSILTYGYAYTCNNTGTNNFTLIGQHAHNFAYTCTNTFDVSAHLSGGGFRPGLNGFLWPIAMNFSCVPVSGIITVTLDPLTTYVSTSGINQPAVNGNTLTWNYTNLTNTNIWQYWNNSIGTVTLFTSLAANIGDTVCFTISVTPTAGDVDVSNNTYVFCTPVTNSYDPNMKEVSPRGNGMQGYILPNVDLTYTVHFQNTGNDLAYNIFIVDTIDTDLNFNTFQILGASHNMELFILNNNVVKFNFPNIMLPDSTSNEPLSHGWVTYKIKQKPNLPDNTQLTNTAYIYFDFNQPIITNTTYNTVHSMLSIETIIDNIKFEIYPNPASDLLTIITDKFDNTQVVIKDMLGKNVFVQQLNSASSKIDVSALIQGMYLVSISKGNDYKTMKLNIVR